jgi:hypothetical protein
MSEEIKDDVESATADTNVEENIEEEGEVVVEEKTEEKKEIRMVWKMHRRDLDDSIKMAEIIAQGNKLKKSTPQFVSKFMFMESLKEYRKAGLI